MISTTPSTLAPLRATYIRVLAIAVIILAAGSLIPTIIVALERGAFSAATPALIVTIVVSVVWLEFLRRGRQDIAGIGLVISLLIPALIGQTAFLILAVLAVISAAVMLNRVGYYLINAILIGRVATFAYTFLQTRADDPIAFQVEIVIPVAVIAIVSMAARYFIYSAERVGQGSVRTANLLASTAEVAQTTSQILELNPMLTRAVTLTRERFGFYHVQVFLLDEIGEYAWLVASTGEIGRQLLERKHRLPVGSQSVIGKVTSRGEPVIARDTDAQNVRFRNELLPETRAELALPIFDGERLIGALDVQSSDAAAFDETEIDALKVLANLLATAIRNARLFERQTETARENERLYQQAQGSLDEIRRLNRQLTGQAWQDYLATSDVEAGVTLAGDVLSSERTWSEPLRRAVETAAADIETSGSQTVTAIPLMLRGQVIGAVEIETDMPLKAVQSDAIQAVLERLSVSLEGARLYAAAQSVTAQELRLNEVSARYQQAGTVDQLLEIALDELTEALGAEGGAIRLGSLGGHANGGTSS